MKVLLGKIHKLDQDVLVSPANDIYNIYFLIVSMLIIKVLLGKIHYLDQDVLLSEANG